MWIINPGSSGIILSSAISAVFRSMISKQVPADELGQVFSVLASLESIVPLMSSSTYNLVYEATIEWFPGCVYLVEAGCSFVIIILLMWVHRRFLFQFYRFQLTASTFLFYFLYHRRWVMILKYKDRNLSSAPYTPVETTPVEVL